MTQSPHRVQRILENHLQFWKARLPPRTIHFEILVRDLTRSAPRRLKTDGTRATWKCPVCLTINNKDSVEKKGSRILYPRGRNNRVKMKGMIEREQTDPTPLPHPLICYTAVFPFLVSSKNGCVADYPTYPPKNPNALNKMTKSH